jgi:hypothetical protein
VYDPIDGIGHGACIANGPTVDEGLKWLFLNADKISVIGLLFALLLSLQRKWVVPGWIYAECITDRDRFEDRVEALAKSNEDKIARLESEVSFMRDQHGRTR